MKRFGWDKKYLYWGMTAFCVIICSLLFYTSISRWGQLKDAVQFGLRVMSPIIYGLIIAYLLTPAVKRLEVHMRRLLSRTLHRDEKKIWGAARGISIVTALVLALLVVTVLLIMLLPQVYASIEHLVSNAESYVAVTVDFAERTLERIPWLDTDAVNVLEELERYFLDWLTGTLVPNIDKVISSVSTGLFAFLRSIANVIIGIIISIYVIYNRELFAAQAKKVLYSLFRRERVEGILAGLGYVDQAFGGFFLGKFVDSAIIGLITFIVLTILKMPYTALISVIIGVTNIIPFFGPFIGAVPSALLILLENPVQCVIFVIFILILQQVDGNIIGPKILSNTTGLSGFWVMFAILLGGGLFGFIGMLCGVPVFSVIYAGLRHLMNRRLQRKEMPIDAKAYAKGGTYDGAAPPKESAGKK